MNSITANEMKIIQSLVDWYIGEASAILKEAYRNAAFLSATQAAIRGLNKVADERFRKVFLALMRDDPSRVEMLTQAYQAHVRERVLQAEAEARTTEKKPDEYTLKNYLNAMTACMEAARHESGALRALDGRSHDEGTKFARTTWAALRAARVFDFPLEDFVSVYQACDQYTCEKIARVPYKPLVNRGTATNEEAHHYHDALNEAGARVPFPEQLPFDHVYIGLGFGVQLAEHQWMPRVGREAHDRVIGVGLLGYLIWPANGGMVVEILQVVEIEDNYIMPSVVCYEGMWHEAVFNLAPWIVTHLVSAINEHRTLVLGKMQRPSFEQRRAFEKESKRLKVDGMLPRPYYLVRLEKKVIEETGRRNRDRLAKISRELSYRYDRRGHERCYIRRGKLPLEPKEAKKLEEAGYKIWTINEPDSNAYRQLMERRQPPKGADEWLAILTKWIDDTIVGPEDKPYVPAIRVPRGSGEPRPVASPGVPREA